CDNSIRRISVEQPEFISRSSDSRGYRQNLQAVRHCIQPVLDGNGKFDPAQMLETGSLPESDARKSVSRLAGNGLGACRQLRGLFHAPNQRMGIPEVLHRFASASQVW